MNPASAHPPMEARDAWRILLELKARGPHPVDRPCRLTLNGGGLAHVGGAGTPLADMGADGSVSLLAGFTSDAEALLALHLDFVLSGRGRPSTVAHLGQSLDGQVATATGDACFINDPANIVHLHRLRALADAVLVGAGTVAHDDPRLTTREVPGPNPVRVVLDPGRRLGTRYGMFNDGAAPTLILCSAANAAGSAPPGVEVVPVPGAVDAFLAAAVRALHERGLYRLFVEGGGRTVSGFLRAGLLDRLQITVAPVIVGAGIPGLSLPGVRYLSEALRPASRQFTMGRDCLFDCRLEATPADPDGRR